jgi:hypothetical protein
MRARRLDDRIRELSAKAVAAKDPEEVHLILSELRATIRQYMQRLKTRSVAILSGRRDFQPERRNAS